MDSASGARQGAMLGRIGCKLMQYQSEWGCNVWRERNWGTIDHHRVGTVRSVRLKLIARQRSQFGALPIGFHEQAVGTRQGRQTSVKARDEFLFGGAVALGLVRYRLNDGQSVLDPVREFAQQQPQPLLPRLLFRYVVCAFKHKPMTIKALELKATFDCQFLSGFTGLFKVSTPVFVIKERGMQRCHRGARYLSCQKFVFVLTQCFFASITVEFFATTIPFENAVIVIPDEYRFTRKIDKLLFLPEPLFACFKRFLRLQEFSHIYECNDYAVNLVFDSAIGPQPNVIPAA